MKEKAKQYEEKIMQLKRMIRTEKPAPLPALKEANTSIDMKVSNNSLIGNNNSFVDNDDKKENLLNTSNMKQLEDLRKGKDKYQKEIKKWMHEFEVREKRKPATDERTPIKHLFEKYQKYNKQIKTLEEKMNSVSNISMNNTSIQNTSTHNISILKETSIIVNDGDDRGKKSNGSPKKIQMSRASSTGPRTNNMILDNLNNSHLEQSFSSNTLHLLPPLSASGDAFKLSKENEILKDELNSLKTTINLHFNENEVIKSMELKIKTLEKEKEDFKEKLLLLKRTQKNLGGEKSKDLQEIDKKSAEDLQKIDVQYRNKMKMLEEEQKVALKIMEKDCEKQISEIIKTKDALIQQVKLLNNLIYDLTTYSSIKI